jgi:hypothetical protein
MVTPVDAVTTHGGNEHHGSAWVRLDHCVTNGLGTDEGPGQFDFNETSGHLNVVTFSRKVGACKEIKLDEEL